jgi:thioredoxin 1
MKKFLYFSATWCGPCRQLGPVMEQLSYQYPVRKIDVDANQLLAQQYKIRNIPTVLLVDDDGEVLASKVGANPSHVYIDMYNQH